MDISFLKPVPVKGKIRLGKNGDGGYVVYERLLRETQLLITYGVGFEVSFEDHFNAITGKKVVMFDPTLFDKYLVDFRRLIKHVVRFQFVTLLKYLLFIASCWNTLKLFRKRNILFVNEGISAKPARKYSTLRQHLARYANGGEQILLKIDIEGNEYDVLHAAGFYESLVGVNQVIIEFHNLKNKLREVKNIVSMMLRDFQTIHIHGNNCSGTFTIYDDLSDIRFPDTIEMTFVRREKIDPQDILTEEPEYPVRGLDFPNNPGRKDYKLSFAAA